MTYNDSFRDRADRSADAKKALLEKLKAAPKRSEAELAELRDARLKKEAEEAEQRAAKKAAAEKAKAEELAAQAEQLQTTIAFFRIDDADAGMNQAVVKLKAKAAQMKSASMPKTSRAAPARSVKGKTGGFAFDLDETHDEQDAQFRRAS